MDDTTESRPPEQPNGHGSGGSEVMQSPPAASPVPTPGFTNLAAPDPVVAAPPQSARAAAFAAILVGGLLGGLVGFGIGDVLYSDSTWSAVAALAGAL
ncbi:MAG: hypothetical protein OEW83_20500, partial [Acidimicrobiia bacterium]|nr:hypothetical protein [Acidimicrobiia bacterium]